ncbi:hypothetical protein FOZ62_022635, partial [Perkinsus olseni]
GSTENEIFLCDYLLKDRVDLSDVDELEKPLEETTEEGCDESPDESRDDVKEADGTPNDERLLSDVSSDDKSVSSEAEFPEDNSVFRDRMFTWNFYTFLGSQTANHIQKVLPTPAPPGGGLLSLFQPKKRTPARL